MRHLISPPAALLGALLAVGAGETLAAPPAPPSTALASELRIAREGARTLIVRPTGPGARIETGDRTATDLRLSQGATITSLVATRDGWVAAGVRPLAGGSGLLVVQWKDGTDRSVQEPGDRIGTHRESPVLLASGGRLAEMLWLEGETRDGLAVRAARWTGDGWSSPITISPQGPGSQLALSATTLPGGDLLAVWSAFDGQDDEILWSRTRAGRWSTPRPLAADNGVPDITPAVAGTAGGALAAWNRYDGEGYSLLGARFDGERWAAPFELAGAGTLYPSFDRLGRDLVLLARQARPRGWTALRLDAEGRPSAQAAVGSPGPDRPVLESARDSRVRFLWIDRSLDAPWIPTLAER